MGEIHARPCRRGLPLVQLGAICKWALALGGVPSNTERDPGSRSIGQTSSGQRGLNSIDAGLEPIRLYPIGPF